MVVSNYYVRGLHNKMNIPADFSLNAEDFHQLVRDFFETLSFKR